MTTEQINARKLLTSLEFAEVSPALAPDCRRVLRDERIALSDALRSGDGATIAKAAKEAVRVAATWHAPVSY